MSKRVINKKCNMCSADLLRVHPNTKYCEDCRRKAVKSSSKRHSDKTQIKISRIKENELVENFSRVVKEPFHLTPNGFSDVSNINFYSYQSFYKKPWIEIVDIFDKRDDLINYVVSEYKYFVSSTGKQDFKVFCKDHKYIGGSLIRQIGYDTIRDMSGVKKKRIDDGEHRKEFIRLIEKYGRVPLYKEFLIESKISLSAYKSQLNINPCSGEVYNKIVRHYADDELYGEYLHNRLKNKSLAGYISMKDNFKYSSSSLEEEFHKVFTLCMETYGDYPSRRLFNKLSEYDDSVYRHRFAMTWLDICKYYGYNLDNRRSNYAESMVLNFIKSITSCDYIPQKTFDWLIGVNDSVLYCDGYFEDLDLVVEFDGRQHREPVEDFGGEETFKIQIVNDQIKNKLIPRHGLKLIRISSESDWHSQEYIEEVLKENDIEYTSMNNLQTT